MSKVALIMGSLRRPGNGIGIANWLAPILRKNLEQTNVIFLDSTKPPLPLGPVVDGTHVPADIRDPTQHPNPTVREFASLISSCNGFVFLSPEYNGSYSGEMKNTLDHLYWEWTKKPALVVTYGGGGGTRAATQLRGLLEGPFEMKLTEKRVAIKWPKGAGTVPSEGEAPDWLQRFEPEVLAAIEEFKRLLAEQNSA